uniref:Uncharacterized protein n=1 Tax=Fagus sylvatica TaxID=28930 RepID=A0A2N9IQF5_FAGSY
MMRMSKDHRSAGLRWSLPLSDAAGYCCRWFCGGVRRGPMDNGKDQLPSSLFLVSIGAAADHFFWKQAMTAG